MILHPDVQAKVQDELDRVVGKERLPGLAEYSPFFRYDRENHRSYLPGVIVAVWIFRT